MEINMLTAIKICAVLLSIRGSFAESDYYNANIWGRQDVAKLMNEGYAVWENTNANSHVQRRTPTQQQDKLSAGVAQNHRVTSETRQFHPSQNQNYIQKMANQLFLTQKHVPLLSEYQKYILNQDPLVKKYVFGHQQPQQQSQTLNNRAKSQFIERSLIHTTTASPVPEARSFVSTRSPVKKQQSFIENRLAKPEDSTPQSTEQLRYVAVPSSTLLTYKGLKNLVPEVTLLSPTENLHYDLGSSQSYQINAVPAVTSISHFGLGSHKTHPIQLKHLDHHGDDHGHDYQFAYDVKDHSKNNNFGHTETRSHDKTVGQYYLQLPDGRFETVNYWADKTGYHAKVDFVGRSHHPHFQP